MKKHQNFCSGGHSAKMYSSKTFEKFWQVYKKFAQKLKKFAKIFQQNLLEFKTIWTFNKI